ncbi:hypothetical protein PIB30_051156 [Stylosanthes scabra]|uniref:Uncharacterized protein n=1 Tax=Stylosanthes scabra TaxID=79078 RepID=A0ABU6RI06_9FABA|nr:hypothetical protein [Stylosanthes scabra]
MEGVVEMGEQMEGATEMEVEEDFKETDHSSVNCVGNHNNLDYNSEPERTLFRRRREVRRARQAALEQQFNMAANNNDIPNHEEQNQ